MWAPYQPGSGDLSRLRYPATVAGRRLEVRAVPLPLPAARVSIILGLIAPSLAFLHFHLLHLHPAPQVLGDDETEAVLALPGCGAGKEEQIWQSGAGGGDGGRLRPLPLRLCCLCFTMSLQAIGPFHTTLAGGMTLLALPLFSQCSHVSPTCVVM